MVCYSFKLKYLDLEYLHKRHHISAVFTQKLENQQNFMISGIFNDLEMAFRLIRKFVEVYFLRTTDQCSMMK